LILATIMFVSLKFFDRKCDSPKRLKHFLKTLGYNIVEVMEDGRNVGIIFKSEDLVMEAILCDKNVQITCKAKMEADPYLLFKTSQTINYTHLYPMTSMGAVECAGEILAPTIKQLGALTSSIEAGLYFYYEGLDNENT